jgi:hypothetical protein
MAKEEAKEPPSDKQDRADKLEEAGEDKERRLFAPIP